MVHLFTDDQRYLEYYRGACFKHTKGAKQRLDFGPQGEAQAKEEAARSNSVFRRKDSVWEALVDFLIMAMCSEFYATKGSTVQFLVEGLAQRFNPSWRKMQVIGTWRMPEEPANAFWADLSLLEKSLRHLTDPEDRCVSSEQMSVLNFLADHHLEEIYQIIVTTLNGTSQRSMPQTTLVRTILKASPTAQKNRLKFKEQRQLPGGFHWFKALMMARVKTYALVEHSESPQIILNNDTQHVSLERTAKRTRTWETHTSCTDTASRERGQPPWTKQKKAVEHEDKH